MKNNLEIENKICYGLLDETQYIEKLEIPEGVEAIQSCAFYECECINTVILPESLKEIGNHAFACSQLKNIVIKSKKVHIRESAFEESDLEKIECNAITLEKAAFYSCRFLESVDLGNDLKDIPAYAFHNCNNLTKFHFPNKLQVIGEDAFSYTGLTEVNFPSTLEVINSESFYSSEIQRINIPKSLKFIDVGAFAQTRLTGPIIIPKSDQKLLLAYTAFIESEVKEITIPDNVTMALFDAKISCDFKIKATHQKAQELKSEIKQLRISNYITIEEIENPIEDLLSQGKSIAEINRIYKNIEETR